MSSSDIVEFLQTLPDLLTAQEVADVLNIARITLNRWEKNGKLIPIVRLNDRGDKRYYKKDIADLLGISLDSSQPFENEPELLTSGDVAKLLRVTKITLLRWEKSGKFVPSFRINERGDKRYTKNQLQAFLHL